MHLVGGKVLERPPIGSGVECDDGKPIFGKLAGERAAASARSDDREIDGLVFGIFAHRYPPARPEDVWRAPVSGSWRSVIRHAHSPDVLRPRDPAMPRLLPRDRGDRS